MNSFIKMVAAAIVFCAVTVAVPQTAEAKDPSIGERIDEGVSLFDNFSDGLSWKTIVIILTVVVVGLPVILKQGEAGHGHFGQSFVFAVLAWILGFWMHGAMYSDSGTPGPPDSTAQIEVKPPAGFNPANHLTRNGDWEFTLSTPLPAQFDGWIVTVIADPVGHPAGWIVRSTINVQGTIENAPPNKLNVYLDPDPKSAPPIGGGTRIAGNYILWNSR